MKTYKLTVYNNSKIVIENYDNIIDISDNIIIIDKYIINGNNLKIKQIEEYFIIIVGDIKKIDLNCDYK